MLRNDEAADFCVRIDLQVMHDADIDPPSHRAVDARNIDRVIGQCDPLSDASVHRGGRHGVPKLAAEFRHRGRISGFDLSNHASFFLYCSIFDP